MGELVITAVAPHPPIIVPGVGGEEAARARATIESMRRLAQALHDARVESIVLISPHSTLFSDAIAVRGDSPLSGNLKSFGADVELGFEGDCELASAIVEEARRFGSPAHLMEPGRLSSMGSRRQLDHGITVPMFFLKQALPSVRLVPVSMGIGPCEELYAFGMGVAQAALRAPRRVALVASGDLSHRLTPDAAAGYSPRGKVFDEAVVQALMKADVVPLVELDGAMAEDAGECGLRSIIMMMGALDGRKAQCNLLSYEGPFGVGYAVAWFKPGSAGSGETKLRALIEWRKAQISLRRSRESSLVSLARRAVESYVVHGRVIDAPTPLPAEMQGKAGVFCSIHNGRMLRGCIGTIAPMHQSIAEEIISNAISAATRDGRFDPVTVDEMDDLLYSVDVLSEPESISGPEQLDVGKYGVIVRSRGRSGLLLPDLDGVDSVDQQIQIARRKAGIDEHEAVKLQRFEVTRYE